MRETGREREEHFADYFLKQIQAKYKLKFRIRFSPEDKVQGGENRTKYYLVHCSNHSKAALLMKEVMWPLGDEMGTFDYSAREKGVLFSRTPSDEELKSYIRQRYVESNKIVTFDELREETWVLPFIEKHYRSVLHQLEDEGVIQIKRVESKKKGIRAGDKIHFRR